MAHGGDSRRDMVLESKDMTDLPQRRVRKVSRRTHVSAGVTCTGLASIADIISFCFE